MTPTGAVVVPTAASVGSYFSCSSSRIVVGCEHLLTNVPWGGSGRVKLLARVRCCRRPARPICTGEEGDLGDLGEVLFTLCAPTFCEIAPPSSPSAQAVHVKGVLGARSG